MSRPYRYPARQRRPGPWVPTMANVGPHWQAREEPGRRWSQDRRPGRLVPVMVARGGSRSAADRNVVAPMSWARRRAEHRRGRRAAAEPVASVDQRAPVRARSPLPCAATRGRRGEEHGSELRRAEQFPVGAHDAEWWPAGKTANVSRVGETNGLVAGQCAEDQRGPATVRPGHPAPGLGIVGRATSVCGGLPLLGRARRGGPCCDTRDAGRAARACPGGHSRLAGHPEEHYPAGGVDRPATGIGGPSPQNQLLEAGLAGGGGVPDDPCSITGTVLRPGPRGGPAER